MHTSVPLKANQVRTRVNKRLVRTYYIVAEDQAHNFHCMWFRTDPEKPMMIIDGDAPYVPSVNDFVVLDNINLLTNTFAEILHSHNQVETELLNKSVENLEVIEVVEVAVDDIVLETTGTEVEDVPF